MTFAIGTPFSRGAGYYVGDKDLKTRREADVATCPHCERVIFLQKWKDDGGFCGKCMKPICGPCADRAMTFGCEPFMQKLEKYAENTMRFEQYRRVVGLEPATPRPLILPGDPNFKE